MIKGRENHSRRQNGGRNNRIRTTITASKPKLVGFIKILKAHGGIIAEFDERLWSSMVDFVTVGRNKEMAVTFRDGTEITA